MPTIHSASERAFERRRSDFSPVRVQNATSAQIRDFSIGEAGTVTLKHRGQDVLVRSITQPAPGVFRGEIFGFEPSIEETHDGMRVGDLVDFEESHVTSYSD